jgi:archaellum component FlaG (FlaF/FlaG flagellin family)
MALCGGIGLAAGHFLDLDQEKRNKENKELNLKGEVSKQIKDEVSNLQEERSREISNSNNIQQQIAQKQNLINDPNTPEHVKTQARSDLAALIAQGSSSDAKIKELNDKIKALIDNAQKTVTGDKGLSLEMKPQTKMMLVAAGAVIVIYWLNKDKN